jgi:choline-glycine betaine transporter
LRDNNNKGIDRALFFSTLTIIAVTCIAILLARDQAGAVINAAYAVITGKLGVLYLAYAIGVLVFLAYLAASRYGAVILGRDDDHI